MDWCLHMACWMSALVAGVMLGAALGALTLGRDG
jgi:hypothetical protein